MVNECFFYFYFFIINDERIKKKNYHKKRKKDGRVKVYIDYAAVPHNIICYRYYIIISKMTGRGGVNQTALVRGPRELLGRRRHRVERRRRADRLPGGGETRRARARRDGGGPPFYSRSTFILGALISTRGIK